MSLPLEINAPEHGSFIPDPFMTAGVLFSRLPAYVQDTLKRKATAACKNYRKGRDGHLPKAEAILHTAYSLLRSEPRYDEAVRYACDVRWVLWEKIAELEKRLDAFEQRLPNSNA